MKHGMKPCWTLHDLHMILRLMKMRGTKGKENEK
jgi:hypothetical protein